MVALVTLGAQSFWVNTAPGEAVHYTLANYTMLLTPEGEMYRVLLLRSLWLSLMMTLMMTVTSATSICCQERWKPPGRAS